MNFQVVLDQLRQAIADMLNVLPRIINGLVLLLVGYLLAAAVRSVLRFGLRRLGFDTLMERLGIADGLRRIGLPHRGRGWWPRWSLCCSCSRSRPRPSG